MNIALAIVGFCAMLGGIIGICVALYNEEAIKAVVGAVAAVVGAVLFFIGCSFTIIPTGYIGVATKWGVVNDEPKAEGVAWHAPLVESIDAICVKQQDVSIEERIWGEAADKTPVYAENIIVSYRVEGDKVVELYKTIKSDVYITAPLVASALKSAMVELAVEDVTVRSKIEPLALEKLNVVLREKYGDGAVTAVQVIVNQMDFEEAYNAAIAAKSIAKQTQERQAIENETAVKKAEADKKVAIANAEAEAQAAQIKAEADAAVAKIKADSDAEVLRVTSTAEAEANRKVAASLDENILKAKFYEAWDGKLPSVMGEGAVITDVGN